MGPTLSVEAASPLAVLKLLVVDGSEAGASQEAEDAEEAEDVEDATLVDVAHDGAFIEDDAGPNAATSTTRNVSAASPRPIGAMATARYAEYDGIDARIDVFGKRSNAYYT